jgi:hypothetical protein
VRTFRIVAAVGLVLLAMAALSLAVPPPWLMPAAPIALPTPLPSVSP